MTQWKHGEVNAFESRVYYLQCPKAGGIGHQTESHGEAPVSQETERVREKLGGSHYYYSGGKVWDGDIPYWAGRKTKTLRFVVRVLSKIFCAPIKAQG